MLSLNETLLVLLAPIVIVLVLRLLEPWLGWHKKMQTWLGRYENDENV